MFFTDHFSLQINTSVSNLSVTSQTNLLINSPTQKNNLIQENSENNPESPKIINIEKRNLMSKILVNISDVQNTGYDLNKFILSIKKWLLELDPIDNEKAYYLSVSIESKNEEETIESLLIQHQKTVSENNELLAKYEKLEKKVRELQASTIRLESQNKQIKEELVKYENEESTSTESNTPLHQQYSTFSKKTATRMLIETRRNRKKTVSSKPKIFDLFK